MTGQRRIDFVRELALILIAVAVYFILKMYPVLISTQYYSSAITLILTAIVGIIVIVFVSLVVNTYGRIANNEREMHEIVRLFRLVAYPLLVLVLLQTIGISIAGLLVGAGFFGIVVGLAAQTTLGNVFAGISIFYSNPFKAGDKITLTPLSLGIQSPTHPHETMLTEITGTVKGIGLIYTKIMRDDWSLMYLPNSLMNQGIIQNLSRVNEKLVRVRLAVPRSTDFTLFKKKLVAKLSKNKEDYEKLRNFDTKISLVSTEQDLGISISARVQLLEYERLSQWLSETAISALNEIKVPKKKQ